MIVGTSMIHGRGCLLRAGSSYLRQPPSFISGASSVFSGKPSSLSLRDDDGRSCCGCTASLHYSTLTSSAVVSLSKTYNTNVPVMSSNTIFSETNNQTTTHHNINIIQQQRRTILSSSSFSSLPPEEEQAEKLRVESLTPYQKEMELRELDVKLQKLNTLRAINTGELYTIRGKFKMLSRDYGMGFLAWYWTCWFATAGLSYAAIELGGVDPLIVANKLEMFLGWENNSLAGRLDPTLGQIGLVVAVNECLEPLRLPFVVFTTKPVVNAFSKKY